MKSAINFVKNHFVETVGFIGVLIIIILVSYLKYFRKTFVCEQMIKENGSKVYQKYEIKQKNNSIKSISYYYKANTPNKKEKEKIQEFYKSMITDNKKKIFDNNITLKYSDGVLILKYNISSKEIKTNKNYKSTKTLVNKLKASKFTCK